MNAESLVMQVRNIIAYDFDLPTNVPSSGITDAEILAFINTAQFELGIKCRLFDPRITFTASGSSLSFSSVTLSKRVFEPVRFFLSDGQQFQILSTLDYLPGNATGQLAKVFADGEQFIFYPSQGTITGTVQGTWVPRELVLGQPLVHSELPRELSERHLSRYAVATNASVFITEGHQSARVASMIAEAEQAAMMYANKSVKTRTPLGRTGVIYRR